MKNYLQRMWFAVITMLFAVNASAVTETYDFLGLLNGGYTTINSSGTKSFEGKTLNVISSFTKSGGEVGANVGGRIAALYQNGNGNNFWMRDASRPWFVSASKTSYMAFDNLKAGDVVKIIGKVYPLTILCDNAQDANGNDITTGTALAQQEGTADNPIVLVAKADGYIYGSYGPYTAITKIIVESTAAETANDPIVTISGANGAERTVTVNANNGSAGTAQTAYYTLDGSDPTNSSTKYTTPITVSETTTVKVIAYCGEAVSNIVTLKVEAGTTITLNQPVLSILNMAAVEGGYAPVFGVSIDNSNLIGSPVATLEAVFNGDNVTDALVAGNFSPDKDGLLTVTASASGYSNSTVKANVFALYTQSYASTDYSTLTDEESVLAVLGSNWSSATTRWANWNKSNSVYGDAYVVYSYNGEAESNIYVDKDEMLRAPRAIQMMESFGFGRGVSGATKVFFSNTGTSLDITQYRVISSKGLDENVYTNTFVQSNEEGYSEFNIPGCETLCQAIIYQPSITGVTAAKLELSSIIKAATSLNEKYLNNSDMTTAIAAAQYVVDNPDATLADVETAIAGMQTIAETKFPEVMAKVEKFLAENPGITVEGIDELEAAVAAKDLVAIGAAADKAYTSFSNAAAAFVQSATDLAAAGEAASAEGVTDLQTAIAAATAVLTADGKTIEDKAKALVALNEALNAYKIANGSDLLKEAVALAADEDAVAVGKLKQAIADALAGDESGLQTAVDQFKADNAPLETDLTSQFSALTDPANWVNANGAWSVAYAGWAAPQVTVDGKSVALVESYRDGQEFKLSTGDVMYQDITGLTPGTYAIELYGAACLTPGRNGMTTDFAEGDENSQKGAYLYAKVGDNILKEYVPCLIEDNMNNRGGEEAIPTAKLSGVVVGEEGSVRVGLAKELGLTNWHFVQLKKVIAQVLAKDLFATDLAKMNATIAEAEALNSKEHLTEGKEALANAIEAAQDVVANKQMYNIDEMQAAVTALENAIAAFKLANYVAYEGVAYVQSVATGKYMAAGHDYGTHGIVNETGLDLTFAANAETKKVTIDSQVSNGGDSHFLGSNLYMDSNAFEWIIEKFGENYSISNGEKYLGVDEKDNLALVDDAYAWAIVPDTDVKAARMATLEGATEIDPVDATWMMSNPNFNRNDQRVSAWAVSEDCTNKNLNGGNQVNNCAESFHSTFTISQAITGAPAGLYKLTAQGFYRQDQDNDKNDVTEAAPKFFIGTETAEVPARAGEESSMNAASESFANGQYTIAPIEFFYDGENTLTVGVEGTALYQWVIFDNFQLSYLGMPSAVVAEAIDDDYFTFSSKYPVDLDNLPEGLKAYYVDKVEGDKAYVEEAPGAVAAGTGLLLKATDKGDYEIPVVAKGSKLDGNLLVGVQEKDVVASDATGAPVIQGAGYYVLIRPEGATSVVFSQVNGEVPVDLDKLVGKAYLYYAANAGKLRIVFPGEATAINSLDAEAQKSGKGIYNLSGQKVNAGYKGIVIVNGKKVMMK